MADRPRKVNRTLAYLRPHTKPWPAREDLVPDDVPESPTPQDMRDGCSPEIDGRDKKPGDDGIDRPTEP